VPEAAEYRQTRFEPPSGALDLLLVRHGQSAPYRPGSPFPLVDGQGDPALSADGGEQAERVGERLAREGIDAVYVSTLRRTSQTAGPLCRLTGLVPQVDAGLREVSLGDWEGGLLRQKVAEGDPIAQRVIEEQRWDAIPGAEPSEALMARVRTVVQRLAEANPGRRVVAFTHGGIIGEVLHIASGAAPFAFTGADNASISQVVVVGSRWVVRRFNDTAHLTSGFATGSTPPT